MAVEGIGIPQSRYDLVDQELGGDPGGHIGVVGHGRGFDAVIAVPQLPGVQQRQGDGLAVGIGHGIPDITATGAAAARYPQILVHVVARSAGCVILAWFDAVQRIVLIGNIVVPCKVPAQIFDVGCFCGIASVGVVGHRHLASQDRGVIGACLVKQKYVGDCGGIGGKPVILNGIFRGIFYRVSFRFCDFRFRFRGFRCLWRFGGFCRWFGGF